MNTQSYKPLIGILVLIAIITAILILAPTASEPIAPTNTESVSIDKLFAGPADTGNNPAPKQQVNNSISIDPAKDHIIGNPNAEIVIIEYSDMDCPFCTRFHDTMKQVMNEYGNSGKVAWVYRHLPLSGHIHADEESIASECVASIGGNDAFWKFTDRALAEVSSSNNEIFDPTPLTTIATGLGVDATAFTDCLNNRTYESDVYADMAEAESLGARGTPFSVVLLPNGSYETIEGAQSAAFVKDVIDRNIR
jgi:protein-disulfide isomerase